MSDSARCKISIHPMLRFIPNKKPDSTEKDTFQYIPCYGLSKNDLAEKYLRKYFNTSHVTVYPRKWLITINNPEFQYIPCYGLSCMA